MRSTFYILSVFLTCGLSSVTFSQRACVSAEVVNQGQLAPSVETSATARLLPDIITIPVVVHVVYNTPEQNISNEQIESQIAVLNRDFRKKNSDTINIPTAFRGVAADTRIEFRLATVDPSGLPTTGIVRKNTGVTAFLDDNIKFSKTGGDDAWSRNEYLNIWVGNIAGGIMGYASAPGCAPEKDGLVIRYNVFGTTPNVKSPYNKGRTTVHEIGHWLGLRHIWGDAACGDDHIDDTPPQQGPTRGCPSGVVSTCASGPAGNMYMNFMDFTNDECTSMFTAGQAARMRNLFAADEGRAALRLSTKANGARVEETVVASSRGLTLFPNPAVDEVFIRFDGETAATGLIIYNHLGQVARQMRVSGKSIRINVKDLSSGMYFISIGNKKVYRFVKT